MLFAHIDGPDAPNYIHAATPRTYVQRVSARVRPATRNSGSFVRFGRSIRYDCSNRSREAGRPLSVRRDLQSGKSEVKISIGNVLGTIRIPLGFPHIT
ncbi:hypothetical protein CC2G_010238 [Coprinopsis cinerea AmutBmut pab1-1]|nr:hypothetical protein CC2G_010238 [Coprinopsis cinerea AmutBmut pab1-1]